MPVPHPVLCRGPLNSLSENETTTHLYTPTRMTRALTALIAGRNVEP